MLICVEFTELEGKMIEVGGGAELFYFEKLSESVCNCWLLTVRRLFSGEKNPIEF